MPRTIWEPAAGDGAIVRPLEESGRTVIAADLVDRGAGYRSGADYLLEPVPAEAQGIVTNPPYKLALPFVQKALSDVPYSAWLLRINFLESTRRLPFFRQHPPARVWVSSRRLPMMHRGGWDGPTAPSNMCFAWFVFERHATIAELGWFDWQEHDR